MSPTATCDSSAGLLSTPLQMVRGLSVHRATPLMYFRPHGPSLFLKVRVLAQSHVAPVARELQALASSQAFLPLGLRWTGAKAPYEDAIKVGVNDCSLWPFTSVCVSLDRV